MLLFCWPSSMRVLSNSIHSCNVIAKTCFNSLVLCSVLRILKTCPISFLNNAAFFDTDTYLHPLLQDNNQKETTCFTLLKLCQRPDFLGHVYCSASFRRSTLCCKHGTIITLYIFAWVIDNINIFFDGNNFMFLCRKW